LHNGHTRLFWGNIVETGCKTAGGAGIGNDFNNCIAEILILGELEVVEEDKLYMADGDADWD
jgi:hypothetical protein